ncbi:5-oxopent-3-ene-1,2,5-tricarboxylate decarboxylase [Rhodoblastus sphagnicola]|uniref:5-oxopent-3-ene-1,2,5-tricarboxylate decarboxylase n=1 Tax=Rhodoblastus sphagnicola TaxID=333368 RepID=A0A2S6NEB4_9HYPH|nr:fumarylacetoacetate hydrolase family protein [Rhodoblastus sphagnicola]MBB4199887.1 2-keto-4-pentenoate hydratase/2-oxohepta-3-ene-1,7-dioic acid hydratase in catechol pathway [Rhodoblastus sphagnicola]PPQ32943.1 5-oxopent-3-ene-1,2,5-tricarboxylate decarboxylase [Rhodoblastus sphagnicola]
MKLASFIVADRSSFGLVENDEIADVGALLKDRYADLKALIADGGFAEAAARAPEAKRISLSDAVLLPVIPNPGKIFCVGHNYESHRQETGRAKTEHPSIFLRFADSQTGHGQKLLRPAVSTMFDFEGELAVVIGQGGRAIAPERALDHVAGYACYNDASVRDWQWHTHQFTPGKNFPGTGAFGPWLVTADEVGDPAQLSVTTRLNGEVVQSQPTAEMIFPIPAIIAYVSQFTPLSPGDVIVTGTPGGVGAKRQPPLWLKDGDRIEVEIPKVGLLVNTVECERPAA